jgi:hypothetical protein
MTVMGDGAGESTFRAAGVTHLRLGDCKVGLLMNFNSAVLKGGLRRFVA